VVTKDLEPAPAVNPEFRTYVDAAGHQFEYALIHHRGSDGLVVHLSAFFGPDDRHRVNRDQHLGYFHRLRMLGSDSAHDWLFLCDTFGAHHNGTYYSGEAGDLFVERAMLEIVGTVLAERGHGPERVVTVGSSAGGHGALVLGLRLHTAGIVAISPHVDLDVAARLCGRYDEVAFACADGDPASPGNYPVTRRIGTLLGSWPPDSELPRLFVQTVRDDVGVYGEQVLPLVESWRSHGGAVELDVRVTGGHDAQYATRPLLMDAVARILAGRPIDVGSYQDDPAFAATVLRRPFSLRFRRRLRLRTRYRALARRLGRPGAPLH